MRGDHVKSRMLCDAIGFRPLTLRQPLALRLTTPSHDPSPSEILTGQCRASRNCLAELGDARPVRGHSTRCGCFI